MKPYRKNPLITAAITLALTLPATFAATFTFSGTTTGSYGWALGTDWDAVPVSNLDTILSYTGVLADSVAIISNNDVASPPFQLNQLNFTNGGPATGTAPTLALQGGQLEFISDTLADTPVLSFNPTGTVLPIISIANNLLLTNDLGVAVADLTSATLSGAISGAGALNKTGLGALTLSGANNYNGLTTISGGNLTLDNASALGGGANVTFAGGALAYTAASSGLDLSTRIKNSTSLVTLKLEGQNVNYTGSIDSSNTAGFQVASDGIGVGGMLTVSAANNYSGDTFIGNTNPPGTQDAASITVSGTGTLGSGTINIGRNGNLSGSLLALTGGASLSNAITLGGRATNINIQNLADTSTLSGTISIQAGGGFYAIQSDAGLLQLTGTSGGGTALTSIATGNRTATLQGAGNGIVSGAIINGAATLSLAKAGAGTWTLPALSATPANNYTGTTIINEGTLAFTTTNPSLTGGLTFGTAASNLTPGLLDLTSANATFGGSLIVNTNAATASEVQIGAAQTLATGTVQIGATTPVVASTVTKLNMTGGGTFNVTGATFAVGGSSSTTIAQFTTLDLTALKATNLTLTGNFRVSPNTGTNIGGDAKFSLPTPVVADTVATTTITTTAGTFTVGGGGANQNVALMNRVTLGTGLTKLNAATFNIGTGGRDLGQLIYDPAQTNGDLIIRAGDGTSRATAINVGSGGGGTAAVGGTILMDLSGHDSDIFVTSLNVGNQARTGNQAYEFNFGVDDNSLVGPFSSKLDATNVNIGLRTGTGTAVNTLTSKVNLSGGTVIFGNVLATGTGVDIGNNANTQTAAHSTIGELNISNGAVTIHNSISMGAAVRLGTNTVAGTGTVTASMNLAGGTTTLGGDIIRSATSPRTTSTVRIIGGTLNMGGNDIGSATETVTLSLQSGVLKNLGEVNGGGLINKTTTGSLTLSGPNTFTGGLDISNGVLKITETGSLGLGAKNINIQNVPYIALEPSAGSILLPSNMTFTTAGLAFLNIAGNNVINGPVSIVSGNATTTATSDSGSLTLAGAVAPGPLVATPRTLELAGTSTGANTVSGAVTDGALTTLSLRKSGIGTWSLTNPSNAYSGNTTVDEGTLTVSGAASALNANPNNDLSTVTIAATGATLNLTYSGTDKVDKLFIGGVQQPAGIYGPTATAIPGKITNTSGTGTLTVLSNPPAGYSSWATLNGASPTDRSADHDFDGVPNGVEFFIGGPTGNTTGFTALPGVTNTLGVLSVTWTKATGYTGTYGTDFVVETSATLTGSWTPAILDPNLGFTVTITGNAVKYTFPAGTINFARLKVTGP